MRIGVHTKALSQKNLPGIGYYTLGLLEELAKLDQSNEYVLVSDEELCHGPVGGRFTFHKARPKLALSYLGFVRAMHKMHCDMLFLPKEVVPFFKGKKPTVITVYDLYYLICPPEIRKFISKTSYLNYWFASKFHFERADKILAISQSTKEEILCHSNVPEEKIVVTPLGYNPSLFHIYPEERVQQVRIKYNLNNPFFINCSSYWWARKNLLRLIEAYANVEKVCPGSQLVIIGNKGGAYSDMVQLIGKYGLENRIHLINYVPREDLPLLFSAAQALVFPSLHEGFGLPIIEAMACGCPVITSNVSAMPEAAGDAALLVDPYKVEEIEQAMLRILSHPKDREVLIQRGLRHAAEFTWKRTARQTLDVFNAFSH